MHVVIHTPPAGPPETYGPYQTPAQAAVALRSIAEAGGTQLVSSGGGAAVTIRIEDETHRWELRPIRHGGELGIHAQLVAEETQTRHQNSVN